MKRQHPFEGGMESTGGGEEDTSHQRFQAIRTQAREQSVKK